MLKEGPDLAKLGFWYAAGPGLRNTSFLEYLPGIVQAGSFLNTGFMSEKYVPGPGVL